MLYWWPDIFIVCCNNSIKFSQVFVGVGAVIAEYGGGGGGGGGGGCGHGGGGGGSGCGGGGGGAPVFVGGDGGGSFPPLFVNMSTS